MTFVCLPLTLLSCSIVLLYVNFCASAANFALAVIFFLGVVDFDDQLIF